MYQDGVDPADSNPHLLTEQVNVLPLHHGATSPLPGYSAWLAPSYLRPVRLVLDERVEVDGTGEDAHRYIEWR